MDLRILLIAENWECSLTTERILEEAGYRVLAQAGPQEDLPARVDQTQPDVVVASLIAPDIATVKRIGAICEVHALPVVVFAERSDRHIIHTAIQSGISGYIVQGLLAARIASILEAAFARFALFQALRGQRDLVSTKLAERKSVERAKGILMRRRNLPEQDAYQALRKMAMDRGKRIGEVAQNIVTSEEMLVRG